MTFHILQNSKIQTKPKKILKKSNKIKIKEEKVARDCIKTLKFLV